MAAQYKRTTTNLHQSPRVYDAETKVKALRSRLDAIQHGNQDRCQRFGVEPEDVEKLSEVADHIRETKDHEIRTKQKCEDVLQWLQEHIESFKEILHAKGIRDLGDPKQHLLPAEIVKQICLSTTKTFGSMNTIRQLSYSNKIELWNDEVERNAAEIARLKQQLESNANQQGTAEADKKLKDELDGALTKIAALEQAIEEAETTARQLEVQNKEAKEHHEAVWKTRFDGQEAKHKEEINKLIQESAEKSAKLQSQDDELEELNSKIESLAKDAKRHRNALSEVTKTDSQSAREANEIAALEELNLSLSSELKVAAVEKTNQDQIIQYLERRIQTLEDDAKKAKTSLDEAATNRQGWMDRYEILERLYKEEKDKTTGVKEHRNSFSNDIDRPHIFNTENDELRPRFDALQGEAAHIITNSAVLAEPGPFTDRDALRLEKDQLKQLRGRITSLKREVADSQSRYDRLYDTVKQYVTDQAGSIGLQVEMWDGLMQALISSPPVVPSVNVEDPKPWSVARPWAQPGQEPNGSRLVERSGTGLMGMLVQLYYDITNDNCKEEMYLLLEFITGECCRREASRLFSGVVAQIFHTAQAKFAQIEASPEDKLFFLGLSQVGRLLKKRWCLTESAELDTFQQLMERDDLWKATGRHMMTNDVAELADFAKNYGILAAETIGLVTYNNDNILVLDLAAHTIRLVNKERCRFWTNHYARVEAPLEQDTIHLEIQSGKELGWWLTHGNINII